MAPCRDTGCAGEGTWVGGGVGVVSIQEGPRTKAGLVGPGDLGNGASKRAVIKTLLSEALGVGAFNSLGIPGEGLK